MKKNKPYGVLNAHQHILLIIIPLIALIAALGIGRMYIPISDVTTSIKAKLFGGTGLSKQMEIVLWNIRFPRILLSFVVGAGLSVSGCAFQSLFGNPLASPDTLGVASGASFGAALGILLGFDLIGIELCAIVTGLLAMCLTYVSAKGRQSSVSTIVLAGIMIGSLFSALVSLVKIMADSETQLPSITYWLMGSLQSASYDSLALGTPAIIVAIVILYLIRYRLNVLVLSDDEAKSTGINLRVLQIITVLCVSAISASCVALCGQVGWVGLLVPHICRMRFGNNHLSLIPTSISFGATFLVVVDTLARTLSASEIPISILTAIIGAPFFIILLRREGWNA